VRYRLDDQGQFIAKGSFGLYHQGPSFLQADAPIGNPDLLPQFSRQYTAGIELRPQRETLIDLSFFYADRTGVIVPTGTSEVFSNSGVGFTNGLQFVVQQKLLQGLEGWLSYSLSRSELAASTIAASYPSPYDQTHVFALALSYLLPGGMKLSGRWQYASGTPTTAVNGSVYDASGNVYLSIRGETLGDRLPAFHQLDAKIEKTWTTRSLDVTAYLDVRNAYNRANPSESLTYGYDYVDTKSRTSLPILPLLGARVNF
jgi:outer membrane receptor protein involved in Fe transport